jgi:hypothetical protein
MGLRPGASRTPSSEATSWGTRSGSDRGARPTHHTPSSKSSTASNATARAGEREQAVVCEQALYF